MSSTVKVAVGKDGRNVMGEGRARLFELILETGSIRQAAMRMGMSYRYAWGVVRHMEKELGEELVVSSRGGTTGGRTVLTGAGLSLYEEFRRISATAGKAVTEGALPVTIVLIVRDTAGNFAVVGGRLPREGLPEGSKLPEVLGRLGAAVGGTVELDPKAEARAAPSGGLLLLYGGRVKGGPSTVPLDALCDEDQEILRA